jgi:hypothetical protein
MWTPDGVALSVDPGSSLVMVSDGAGGAVVAFTVASDLFAQRVSSQGSLQWGPNGTAVCTAPDHQETYDGVVLGACGIIVGWTDRRAGDYDVYAQALSLNGELGCSVTAVHGEAAPVPESRLGISFPNPFRPSTHILYTIAESARVKLRIFDSSGRFVAELVDRNEFPGSHTAIWDGSTHSGATAPSGVYWAVLEAGQWRSRERLTLMR